MKVVAFFMAARAWARVGAGAAGAGMANARTKAPINPARTPRTMLVSPVVEIGVARNDTGVIVLEPYKCGGYHGYGADAAGFGGRGPRTGPRAPGARRRQPRRDDPSRPGPRLCRRRDPRLPRHPLRRRHG